MAIAVKPNSKISLNQRQYEALTGYLFVLPTVLGFLIFTLGPILAALAFSFTKYDILSAPEFIGLNNYSALLSDDRLIISLRNTVVFAISVVSLTIAFGLLLAVGLNQNPLLPPAVRNIFRSIYFFPILVAMIYVAMIWQFWFHTDLGVVNYYLGLLNIEDIRWLSSSTWSLASVILVYFWKNVGFSMLIFLAGLQNISQDYYEAADIDGANSVHKFFKITVPLLSPVILFVMVINFINALQEFDSMIVLTNGGPGDASRSIVLYIYEKAFQAFDMGYASAVSIGLFIIIMIFTLAQLSFSREWVHYE